MTDSPPSPVSIAPPGDASATLRAVETWLDQPDRPGLLEEVPALVSLLSRLRSCHADRQSRNIALSRMGGRIIENSEKLLAALASLSPPPTGRLRQLVRGMQNLLAALAEDLESMHEYATVRSHKPREIEHTLTVQRMRALSQHLLISDLTAAPAGSDIWQQLHRTYCDLRRYAIGASPDGTVFLDCHNIYFAAILLACAQPAAFTPRETWFLAHFLARHVNLLRVSDNQEDLSGRSFWIDPARDAPATPCARKGAPETGQLMNFSCDRLATLIREQLAAIRSGVPPERIGLPDFAGTPAGRGALHRLAESLESPGKRRFPRRRQHYRAVLCAGLQSLWNLFSRSDEVDVHSSSWMIANESPDGYSIMHVHGDTSGVSVGDIVALKPETGCQWLVCIIRWGLSENQEHLEFGLQILATEAIPAMLATLPERESGQASTGPRPALILPRVPPLRLDEMLITPSGLLDERPEQLVLVIEQGNIEVREVRSTRLNEQNGLIEVFSIEPEQDPLPA